MPQTRMVYKLKNTTAVTDIVGAKVFPVMADDTTALPYITYQTISDQSINHATGATETNRCRIQVDVWASTYAGAKALAKVVKTALKSWTDATGDPVISSCHYENGNDLSESLSPGQERRDYRVSQDYFVWYTPAA